METKNYCAYNVTRNTLLSERVTMADASLGSMKILDLMMHGPEAERGSAVWLTGCTGSPNVPRLFAFEVLYMDSDFRVLEAARVSAEATFPAAAGGMAGALILPDGMLASSGTEAGDLLRVCDDGELAALIKAGAESILEQRQAAASVVEAAAPVVAATAPVAAMVPTAAGRAEQATVPFEVVRTAGFVFEPFIGSLVYLAEVRAQGAHATDFFLPGAAMQSESAHAFAEMPVAAGVNADAGNALAEELIPEESTTEQSVFGNGEIKWGEPKKNSGKAAREEELRFYRPQPLKFFDPQAGSEAEGEAAEAAEAEGTSNQLPPELKAAILQIDEQLRQKKEKAEQKETEQKEKAKPKKSRFRKAKAATEREVREAENAPEEITARRSAGWGEIAAPQQSATDELAAEQVKAPDEAVLPLQESGTGILMAQPEPVIETLPVAQQTGAPMAEETPPVTEEPRVLVVADAARAIFAAPEAVEGAEIEPVRMALIPETTETVAAEKDEREIVEVEPQVAAAESAEIEPVKLAPISEITETVAARKSELAVEREEPVAATKGEPAVEREEPVAADAAEIEPEILISIPTRKRKGSAPKEEPRVVEPEPQVAAAAVTPERTGLIAPVEREVEEIPRERVARKPIVEPAWMRAPLVEEPAEVIEEKKPRQKKQKLPLKERLHRWFEGDAASLDGNRRRAERLNLPGLVAFYWSGGTPRPHEVVNISKTGFYLKTKELWSVETLLRMTLQRRAADEEEEHESISVLARVVRIDEDGVGHEFITNEALMGARSRDVLPDHGTNTKELDRFLQKQ